MYAGRLLALQEEWLAEAGGVLRAAGERPAEG